MRTGAARASLVRKARDNLPLLSLNLSSLPRRRAAVNTLRSQAAAAQPNPHYDVALVGGGFSGTVVAVQLARLAQRPLRLIIFDRDGAFGRGAAYAPDADRFVLNVRAKAMGAFPDAEDDFLHWLRGTGYGAGDPDLGERFVPRRLYGEYLGALLDRSAAGMVRIERRRASVAAVVPLTDGYAIETACATRISAKAVVLAIGNLPPGGCGDALPPGAMARHARNPWELIARSQVDRDADVLIVGTGLTALDVLLHVTANAHRAAITMLSRHGRFPLAHAASPAGGAAALPPVLGKPLDVLRAVRRHLREAARSGQTWQSVIDGLRPQTNRIWEGWTTAERRQFARHLESVWESCRHRSPQATLDVARAQLQTGRLRLVRGRVRAIEPDGPALRISYGGCETAELGVLRADVVVDCTGPRLRLAASGDPLIENLFARELARPGPLGIGLAAAPDGTLSAAGRPPLFALGTPLRGMLAESSAVREIRVQALTVARAILAALEPAG